MAQNKKVGTIHTTVKEKNDVLMVTYHSTDVVIFDRRTHKLTLDTGGYFSYTTKTRMNQTANQFDLGFNVYQKAHKWFVDANDQTFEFMGDSIEIFLN